MRRAPIKRTDAEAIQSKDSQREEKGDNKESGCRGHTDKGPQREEKGDNKESGCRGYTDQGPVVGGVWRQ